MKHLLIATAMIEAGAGVALLGSPSTAVALLLGSPLDAPAAVALGRVAGAALLALGVACALARGDAPGRAARGLVVAMMLYNLGATAILGITGIPLRPTGAALWPAIVLHAAMTVWCVTCLLGKRT